MPTWRAVRQHATLPVVLLARRRTVRPLRYHFDPNFRISGAWSCASSPTPQCSREPCFFLLGNHHRRHPPATLIFWMPTCLIQCIPYSGDAVCGIGAPGRAKHAPRKRRAGGDHARVRLHLRPLRAWGSTRWRRREHGRAAGVSQPCDVFLDAHRPADPLRLKTPADAAHLRWPIGGGGEGASLNLLLVISHTICLFAERAATHPHTAAPTTPPLHSTTSMS